MTSEKSAGISTIQCHPFNITINVEGRKFNTSDQILRTIPSSLLASLGEDSEHYHAESKSYCFDRDSNLFPHILAAHRDLEVHVPQDVCAIRFRKELEFWRIPKSLIAPCCWKYYYNVQEDLEVIHKITETLPKNTNPVKKEILKMLRKNKEVDNTGLAGNENKEGTKENKSLPMKIWQFLEEPRSSVAAKIWFIFYTLVVVLSVVLNITWLYEGVRVEPYLRPFNVQGNQTFNSKVARLLLTDPYIVMLSLDCFCTIFFTVELCVDFAVCPNKRCYLKDIFQQIKIMLAFSMLVGTVFELRKDWLVTYQLGMAWFFVKSINIFRIFLLFKLAKLSSTFNVATLAFFSCHTELILLLFMLLLMIIVYGGLIFAFEMDSEMFPDPMTSMWWALITMTTIGYGDFHPTRPMGYVVGSLCAIEGIIVIALPIAVVASQFYKFKDRNDDVQKYLKDIELEQEKTKEDASTLAVELKEKDNFDSTTRDDR